MNGVIVNGVVQPDFLYRPIALSPPGESFDIESGNYLFLKLRISIKWDYKNLSSRNDIITTENFFEKKYF